MIHPQPLGNIKKASAHMLGTLHLFVIVFLSNQSHYSSAFIKPGL